MNLDVDHANLAWMDGDRTYQSRELLADFQGSGRFDVVAEPANDREVQQLLDSNRADLVVRVLPGFERDLARGRTTSVQVLINGSQFQHGVHRFRATRHPSLPASRRKCMQERNRDPLGRAPGSRGRFVPSCRS